DIQRDSDGYIYSYGIEYVGDGAIRILAKHDTLGNFINSKKFGYQWNSSNWITIGTMIATDDGGFIVTGSQENSKTGKNISRVEKIDKQGNVLDSLIFGDNAAFYEPKHVERTFDGHYVIFMNVYTGNFYTSHTYVVKVDQNLKIVNMDTVTQFHYDPYCGHKPTSDTIYLDASTTKVVEFKADSSMVYRYVHIKTGVAQEIAPRRMWLNSYPNPASDRIFVNLKEFGNHNDLELELYDMQGRKISTYTITKGTETYTILLDSYAKGSYAMHIKSEGKILAGNAVVVQ
ncbi:MAG: T9SS type A sorting domain-containing protein, partial [Bacteroidetes bacterium]|nr:T9SS type A sorting domain-containing protein [Bacteroidota bacterium]